jgi:beta-lactamase regulating signal transducer with metallopeptidase domain
MLCILYVNVIGACLGIAALLMERVLPAAWPRRWVWCAAIAISMTLPAIYRARHAWAITDPAGRHMHQTSRSMLDRAWWAHTDSFNGTINRIWLATSIAVLAWSVVSMLRVAGAIRLPRRGRRDASGATLVVDGVPVLITERMGPATVGVWRSRVVVPRWVLAMPPAQRRYVLRHEEEHRRAHDARLLFALSLNLILLPWSVALWWQLRRLHLAVEMDCDTRVVKSLGDASAYGALLLKVAEAASRGPRLQPALLGGVGMLERRLAVLLAPTPLRHAQRVLLPALALGLVLLVLALPHPVIGR